MLMLILSLLEENKELLAKFPGILANYIQTVIFKNH